MARHGGGVRRGRAAVAAALTAALVVVGGLGWIAWDRFGPRAADVVDDLAGQVVCTTSEDVGVTTTPAMLPALQEVAASVRGACARYVVTAEPTEVTARRVQEGADVPAVWVPDSVLAAQRLAEATGGLSVGDAVATTPVLLAVPDGLEAPEPLTWGGTIMAEGTRLPDPGSSTAGSVALMVGLAEIDALPAPRRAERLAGIGGMLGRVVPEDSLVTAHASGPDAALFPVTEQQAFRAAVPGLRLATPESATPPLAFPVVTRQDTGDGVRAFVEALRSDTGSAALRAAGFRTPVDASPVVAGGPPASVVRASASPEQAAAAEELWAAIATPTRLLNVIDTSGSMRLPASEGGRSRIEVAATASSGANQLLSDHNAVGLWTFSTDQRGDRDWTELVPVAPLGEEQHRSDLAFALGSLATRLGGDTGLYDTVDAGYRSVMRDYDPDAVNLMVVFTDGVNDDPGGGLSLAALRTRLARVADPERPVTVLLIGMGGVDAAALRSVAAVVPREGGGGGAVFTIEQPQDIADVYVTMLLRRLPTPG